MYYYHLDQLNTPRFVTNNKAEVVWENQADVYGYEELKQESLVNTENSFTQPIRFQGQYLDEESGLHYNRYRYYSPKQQRFINQDPIGLVGGINHYQYAPNPVNWVDPFGLMCKEGEASLKEALNNCTQSGVISPELSEQLLQAAYGGQLTPKEIKGQLSQIPQEEGLKSVSILPIEWAVEGVADVADALIGMFDEGITAAGVATVAIAAIPGKAADKVLEPVVKKLDNAADAAKTTVTQGAKKALRKMEQYDVPCFTPGESVLKSKAFGGNKKKMEKEFYQQIKDQEEGINKLTVSQYLQNREKYKELGRDGVSDGKAQRAANNALKKELIAQFRHEAISSDKAKGKAATEIAKIKAKDAMKNLAALHDPDMIAGGDDIIKVTDSSSGMGNTNVNSSIGVQWKQRIEGMDNAAKDALKKHGPDSFMNVNLSRCKV